MNQPTTAHPGQTEGTASVPTPYSAAPGRNGAAARRRPRRRRGPASERRSKARATTYQVTLEASRGSIHRCHLKTMLVLPVSMQLRQRKQMLATPPPPPPPPPPAKPARFIKVVKRPAGYQLSFTQLDGKRGSLSSEDCPSTPMKRRGDQEDEEGGRGGGGDDGVGVDLDHSSGR